MRCLSIQLKYSPWRDALVNCWSKVAKQQGFRCSDVQGRARILTETLRSMCVDMDGVDTTLWSDSLGRNISHANGPLATLHRLGILTVQKRHLKSRRLRVGQGTGRWLCSGVLAITKARAHVSRWVLLADACQVVAPSTCHGWVAEQARVNRIFQNCQMFADASYMRNFVIRGLLLAAMAAAGVPKLTGAAKIDVQSFAASFPDQRCWICRLSGGRPGTLAEFAEGLGYDGRPELLTMFLCLLLTRSMQVNPAWLLARRARLSKAMLAQRDSRGLFKLPALCVQAEE